MYYFVKHERQFYFLLFFILNMIEMILEMVASRVMSPYFGTSNFVWTAVIGVILLAASIGNFLGGKLSEKKSVDVVLPVLLFLSAITILVIPFLMKLITPIFLDLNFGIRFDSIVISIILFLVPSILISIITPFLMKSLLEQTDGLGDCSGKIHSLIAIGSLFGTFIGGFYLIPTFGTNKIICFLSLMLFVLFVMFYPKRFKFYIEVILVALFLCVFVWFIQIYGLFDYTESDSDMKYSEGISIDTEYSRIIVQDIIGEDGQEVRLYRSAGGFSSGMYLDKDKQSELVFDYTKGYNRMFDYKDDVNNILMIGGAAYSYPKYFLSHYSEGEMTVVEIDPEAEKIAKKYFYLDDYIDKYNGDDRLHLITDDGRVYLNDNKVKYDVILNDAFSGNVPVATLATKECVEHIYDSLTDTGIYIANCKGSLNGTKNGKFLPAELKTLKEVFPYVYIFNSDGTKSLSFSNYDVIASKIELKDDSFLDVDFSDAVLLTDDYCPIDKWYEQ